jgi:hypothetical protein
VADNSTNHQDSVLSEDLEEKIEPKSSKFRGILDTSSNNEPEEESDDTEIEAIFKLHGQICSKVEATAQQLNEIFPLVEQLYEKITTGDIADYRIDRRLRIPSLVQTITVAHSHLNKAARSARLTLAARKNEITEIRPPVFE